jgi:hypothetical protein
MKARLLLVLILPILLAGCLLMPGQFGSTLDVRKDGTFSFAYKGEIVAQTGERMFGGGGDIFPEPDANEKCWGPKPDGKAKSAGDEAAAIAVDAAMAATDEGERDCTKEELAERKKAREEARASAAERRKKEGEQFAQMSGFNPADEEAMARFAAQLAKQKGWKSVTYKGKGVFDVDYAITGRLDHDFVFPVFQKGNALFPFVIVRKRGDGSVSVNAPAFMGGGMAAMAALYGAGGGGKSSEFGNGTKPKGSFTITSDGSFLTNNTEDGPTKSGATNTAKWTVGADSDKTPEALIKLD